MPRKAGSSTVERLSGEEIAAVEAWLDDLDVVLAAWAHGTAPDASSLRSWALRAGWARAAPHTAGQATASRERLEDLRAKRRQLRASVRVPDGAIRCWARYALPGYSDPRAVRRGNAPEIDDLRAAWRRDPSVPRFMPSRKVLMREAWRATAEALAAVERGREAPRGATVFAWIVQHRALVPTTLSSEMLAAGLAPWLSDAGPRHALVDAIDHLALVFDVYEKAGPDGELDRDTLCADVDAALRSGGKTFDVLHGLVSGRFDVVPDTVRAASKGVVGARARPQWKRGR